MKAEDQNDNYYAICPYCEHNHSTEAENYNESGTVRECDECGMKFHYATNISVCHSTSGDCELNNQKHEWKNLNDLRICEICDSVTMKPEESK